MVTDRATDSGAAGVCCCPVLFLARSAYLALHGAGIGFDDPRAGDSGAGFGIRTEERIARYFRSLRLYAQSALFGIAVDGGGILRGGSQLVGGGRSRGDIF